MKKLFFPMALAALYVCSAAAQSVFEGTWKVDFSKAEFPAKPEEYLLQDGKYTCKTCGPDARPIKADGTDQPVTDQPTFDAIAAKPVGDHKMELTMKKAGKVVHRSTYKVSPDGHTLNQDYSNISPSGVSTNGSRQLTRVADGPPGAHLMSGSWIEKKWDISENASLFTVKVKGDELTMSSPDGTGYTARLDGADAPYKGDPGITSVRVKLVGSDTFEETDLRDGKVLYISRMTVGADGKKAKIVQDDKRQDSSMSFEAVKQ